MKFALLVAVPPGVVTVIFPVIALAGTTAVIDVGLETANVIAAPVPNLTDFAPLKAFPVIVTFVPAGPDTGVKEVMAGADVVVAVTVKLAVLVAIPSDVAITIFPVVALAGTTAVTDVALLSVIDVVSAPLNVIAVAPVRSLPVIVTFVPGGPLVGAKDIMIGDVVTVVTV